MKNFLHLIFITFLVFVVSNKNTLIGQTTAVSWSEINSLPGGNGNFGPSPYTPDVVHADVIATGLVRGAGIETTGTGAGNAWGGNGFTIGADLNGAIAAGEYVYFSLTPNAGKKFSLSQIAPYNIRRSGSGPTIGQWQYSIDGINFFNIGGAITWGGTTNNRGNDQSAIDLSAISDLQEVTESTTVTFRLVTWGATNITGTFYFNAHTSVPAANRNLTIIASEITLPIDLLTFTATSKEDKVVLDWTYANAEDFDKFVVER